MANIFVRFVIDRIDEDSQQETGIFQEAYRLFDGKSLPDETSQRMRDIFQWFRQHLDTPKRLSRSSRGNSLANAISWFRGDAEEHIGKARELVDILSVHDVRVTMITTSRPGYIVYEDEFPVAAVPFRNHRG